MRSKQFLNLLLIIFLFFIAGNLISTIDNCQAQTTSSSFNPNDQRAIQSSLQKAGINLTPEEIRKGKEAFERQKSTMTGKFYKMPNAPEEPTQLPQNYIDTRTVIEQPKEVSVFNRIRKVGEYQEVLSELKPFGYDFFHGTDVRILTERQDIPVPINYVIGPGDEIRILLWGRMSNQLSLIVDRDGKITIPDIGPIQVAGMTFEQMSRHLISKAEQIVGTNIDVSMGSTRTIPVFVLGDVEQPGSYTIGALATITDALMLARGPSAIGSMRKVELRRKGKIISKFDLYDLFLKGDKSRDVVLQAGDVVFVPVAGPLVGITGNVKRPAIYELKDKFDLQHLFDLAGGIIPSAYTQQMQVERVIKNEKQVVIDINDKTLEKVKYFVLQDADLVKVFSIMDIDTNAIYLKGNVKRPGKYSYQPGMRIRDIISQPNDLQSEAYLDYALIKRESPPNREPVLIPFNLGRLLLQNDETYNYELTPKDQIFIFHQSLFKIQPYVTLEGEIRGDFGPLAQDKTLKPDQYGASAPGQPGTTAPGQYGISAPGQSGTTAPGQYGTAVPGQYGVSAPGQPSTPVPGQYGAPAPGQYGVTVPGQYGTAVPGQYSATVPSQYGATVPGQYGTTASGQYGAPAPGQYIAPYNENLLEIRLIKDELNYDYDKNKKDKDENYYLLIAKIEEIEDEIEKENRLTPGVVPPLQIELEKIDRKDLSLRLGKLENKMKVICRIDLVGNMKVKDAILNAGGLTNNASMEKGEIIRQYPNNEYRTTYFNVAKAMAGDPRDNLLLQDRDRIIIHSVWEKNPKKSIFVSGDVTKPGAYQFTENMTVRDLIFKAGNVLDSAYLDEAEITSVSVVDGKLGQLKHRSINLRKAIEGVAGDNVVLAPHDRLHVKQIADYKNVRFITVSGQVAFPGKYPFRKGERLSDIIERAGGFTPYAYLRGAQFTRLRVKELQQQGLMEMADRMERELFVGGAEELSAAVSREEIEAKKVEMEQKKKFVDTLRKAKALGRMKIYVADARNIRNTEYDFELEDGDMLNIPERNSAVNVVGSVMSQGSHLYSDKLSYQDYIDASGGYSYYADKNNVYVLKVDGGAQRISNNFIGWNTSSSRWEMTAYGGGVKQIEPGDTIVVPEKAEKIAWMREIKDITQILMNIAVVAGITLRMF
ncbi:MAG: SLBB domain-containing protein [Syntrophaceae bacterium]|nr:SLBB domain-containing protein [Syntrophaceae bacterium]